MQMIMYQIYVVRVLNDKNTIQMYDLILYITIKFCFIKKNQINFLASIDDFYLPCKTA